jgi:hypothetical protein
LCEELIVVSGLFLGGVAPVDALLHYESDESFQFFGFGLMAGGGRPIVAINYHR